MWIAFKKSQHHKKPTCSCGASNLSWIWIARLKAISKAVLASWLTCSACWPKKSFVIQPIFPFSILKKSSSSGQKLQRICSAAGNHKSSWRQSSGEEVASAEPSCPSVLLPCSTAQALRACSALPAIQAPQKCVQPYSPCLITNTAFSYTHCSNVTRVNVVSPPKHSPASAAFLDQPSFQKAE